MSRPSTPSRCGLAPLLPTELLLSTLATKDGDRSATQLCADVKTYLTKEQALAAFEALVRDGYATEGSGRAKLTKLGVETVKARFNSLPRGKVGRKRLECVIWPALVLGIDPASKAASRLAQGDSLRAAALTAVLDLPLNKETVTLNGAVSTLLVRALSGAGAPTQTGDALKALAHSLHDLSSPDALRRGLALAGLALGPEPNLAPNDPRAFATRVRAVVNRLST